LRVLIVAGDPSGDHEAARLAAELHRRAPGLELYGYGGTEMRAAGVRIDYELVRLSAIGFVDCLPKVPAAYVMLRRLIAEVRRDPPDVAVLVDCGGFNLPLGRALKALGVPVLGYFQPGSWSGSRKRAVGVSRSYSAVATPFPQALPRYAELGFPATLVGHPLSDELAPAREARQGMALDPPVLALLPGSRAQEVRHILPPMLDAAKLLRADFPGMRVVVSLAPSAPRTLFDRVVKRSGVGVEVVAGSLEAMRGATAAVVKAGTVALEATLLELPMVCVYRASVLAYLVASLYYWPRPKFWAMPNILNGEFTVPQRFQFRVNGVQLATAVRPLLSDTEERRTLIAGLVEATAKLGGGGATARTAELVLAMLPGADQERGRGS
jgi:lipid-A-disaccharide synthase